MGGRKARPYNTCPDNNDKQNKTPEAFFGVFYFVKKYVIINSVKPKESREYFGIYETKTK